VSLPHHVLAFGLRQTENLSLTEVVVARNERYTWSRLHRFAGFKDRLAIDARDRVRVEKTGHLAPPHQAELELVFDP
jgi:hypothetical protein